MEEIKPEVLRDVPSGRRHKGHTKNRLLTGDQHHGGGGGVSVGEAPQALAQLVVSGILCCGIDVGHSDLGAQDKTNWINLIKCLMVGQTHKTPFCFG